MDLVIEACLHAQGYDQQTEGTRGPWLFSLFENSDAYPDICNRILMALATEEETWNLQQLCQLAKEIAQTGDQRASAALRQRVLEIASSTARDRQADDQQYRVLADDWIGVADWVDLVGEAALLELAQVYGKRLQKDPNDHPSDDLLYLENFSADAVLRTLRQQSQTDIDIKIYADYLENELARRLPPNPDVEQLKQQARERFRKGVSLGSIIERAKRGEGEFPGSYMMFGRHATVAEITEIYELLLQESDPTTITRLLWVFRRRAMPALHPKLIDWANGADADRRSAAIAALAQMADPQIHALARSKMSRRELIGPDLESIGLFILNYANEDAALIAVGLESINADEHETHSIGYAVLDVSKQQQDPALDKALEWVYHNTPCSHCRYNAIKQLNQLQKLPQHIIEECRYDASPDIRAFIQAI